MFKLPILGAGTGNIEALPSYLHRCANAHSVSTKQYLEYIRGQTGLVYEYIYSDQQYFVDCLSPFGTQLIDASPAHGDGLAIVYSPAFDLVARFYYTNFEMDIYPMTFHKTFESLAPPKSVFSKVMRWCPECFSDALEAGSDPYVKLIWYLSDITHCGIHALPLIHACISCGKLQSSIFRAQPIYICRGCKSLLIYREPLQRNDLIFSWEAQCPDIIKYIVDIANNGLPSNMYRGIEKSINDFTCCCLDDNYYDAFRYCWSHRAPRDEVWGAYKLTLATARQICRLCNIDLYDFFTGNFLNANLQLPWKISSVHPYATPSKEVLEKHIFFHQSLLNLMEQYPPLSIESISKFMSIEERYIKFRFPSIYEKIIEKFGKWKRENNIKQIHEMVISQLSR
jgi:hypothetical protein